MTSPSRLTGALQVLAKEVREALRDRNLLLHLVLVPAFLYPVMGFGAYQVYLIVKGAEEKKATVVLVDEDAPPEIRQRLADRPGLAVKPTPPALDPSGAAPSPGQFRDLRAGWPEDSGPAPSALLAWWTAPAAGRDSVRILYDSSRSRSTKARDAIDHLVSARQDSLVLAKAELVGLGRADVDLWSLDDESVASSRQMGSYVLSLMLPLFLMIMLAQGAYYSTLDTVVGEKERGTLETILTSPLDRGQIMLGKFLFVVVSSLIAFLLNLAGLLVFITFLIQLLGTGLQLSFTIPLSSVVLMVLAAVLATATLAAVMMLVSVPANNYRQGQASLMPIYMIATLAGVVVIATETPFTVEQAIVPAVNVVALLKAILRGDVPLVPALVAYGELAVLAVAAMILASRIASKEGVFFDPEITLKRLLGMGKESK